MLLIQNITIADPKTMTETLGDLLLDDGKIIQIAGAGEIKVAEGMEVIDGTGLVAGPGLIDVHVHFRDPGLTYKEDIYTGAKSAAAGGFTTVVMMANTKPAIDSVETLSYVLEKGRETDIHVESCATVTVGMKGEQMVDMDALKAAGAIGFTDDGVPILEEALARKAMLETARLQVPISFHEEHPMFISNNGINRGKASMHFEIGGSDRQAEISMVERDVQIALETGASMNVQHISTKEGVEAVRNGKAKGGAVWAEATPHHIALTEEAAIAHGTLAKMNPPLRTEEDRQAIIQGLVDGAIDLIATDHAPHSAEEKAKAITDAPSGIIGLETSLALCVTHLVKAGHMNHAQLMEKMSYNPARLYHLEENRGHISVGADADLVLYDPKAEWTVGEIFASKSVNTPFVGATLTGQVRYTICGGKVVYKK
jgi:dihydroorotase